MTVEQMHETVRTKMIELRFPRFLALQLAKQVYQLKRWAHPIEDQIHTGIAG
jgi:hypothetical protein